MSKGLLSPNVTQLAGKTVTIGGTDFRLGPDANTIYGLAADRPTAANAASEVGVGAFYYSVDTQAIDQTDGTNWIVV